MYFRLKGKNLPYYSFTNKADPRTGNGLRDLCTMLEARAFVVDGHNDTDIALSTGPMICVELVGNRFLRQMVRILVATALRESSIPVVEGNDSNNDQQVIAAVEPKDCDNVLVDICLAADR